MFPKPFRNLQSHISTRISVCKHFFCVFFTKKPTLLHIAKNNIFLLFNILVLFTFYLLRYQMPEQTTILRSLSFFFALQKGRGTVLQIIYLYDKLKSEKTLYIKQYYIGMVDGTLAIYYICTIHRPD